MDLHASGTANSVTAADGRPWWRRRWLTLLAASIQGLLAGYLVLAYQLNPVPDARDLQPQAVTVVQVQPVSPHLLLRLADGSTALAELPVHTSIRPKRYEDLPWAAQQGLAGCTGTASLVPMQAVSPPRLRAWSLDCGGVQLPFAQVRAQFLASDAYWRKVFFGYLLVALGFTAFARWLDHRDEKGRKP